MKLEKLHLQHFRNYKNITVTFQEGINFIYGSNAQGKTNLLESIYYLSTISSHHVSQDSLLIEHEEEYFLIEGAIQRKQRGLNLRVIRNSKGKHLLINKQQVKKNSLFFGQCNVIMFAPEDIQLFSTTPKTRRRFIDLELSKVSHVYLHNLSLYERLLKEKNIYLKRITQEDHYLDVLDEQMAECMVIIIKQRYLFLKSLLDLSTTFFQEVSKDQSELSFRYSSFVDVTHYENVKKEEIIKCLVNGRERDRQYRTSSVGIHKDDVRFYLNDKDIAQFGSQGQKRTLLLSLKLGLILLIKQIIGEYPILLLDDVFSELDENRRVAVLEKLPKEVQIFISTTDRLEIKNRDDIHYYQVQSGTVMKR